MKEQVFQFSYDRFIVLFLGIGGTCVNVGCIPKKLMHQAAILGMCFYNVLRDCCMQLIATSVEIENALEAC